MPLPRAASLRSARALRFRGQQGPRLDSPLILRIQNTRHPQHEHLTLLVVLNKDQCRQNSTSPPNIPPGNPSQPGAQGPKPSLNRLILRAIANDTKRAWHNLRSSSFRQVMKTHPGEAFGAIFAIAAALAVAGYCIYIYFNYFYSPQFTRYPEPIAQALRKALYYSNHEIDPQRALKHYKQALELCDEFKLDHFSDDVMGIKIQVAAWLEKIQSFRNAIDVLETLLSDCKRWVDAMEKAAREGTLPPLTPSPPPEPKEGEPAPDTPPPEQQLPVETWWGKRTRILGKAIGISVKLAELYSDEHVLERELAHERLVWAVETIFRETQRRAKEGLKEGEGEWLKPEEIGGSMEALARSYTDKSQHHLALPLYFQSLRLCEDQCHIAVLMNNIASSFAEHPLMRPGDAPVHSMMGEALTWTTPAEQRASYLEAAQRWAQNAFKHASEPLGNKRTPECDQACAAALTNLSEVLSMLGRKSEARSRLEQALKYSKEKGLEECAREAEERLRSFEGGVKQA